MCRRCDAELCPFWTGDGCACEVLNIAVEQRSDLLAGIIAASAGMYENPDEDPNV